MFFKKNKILKSFECTENDLLVTICDINKDLLNCFMSCFCDISGVQIIEGNLIDIKCDALISPANSFGDMGGGVDRVIDDWYKGEAQKEIVQLIRDKYMGELPVGTAVIVKPASNKPAVICAPTMRIPGNVSVTINAYLAMRAILVCAVQNKLKHIAVPGLCSGVGAMPHKEVASQMRKAYDNIISKEWMQIIHPLQAPFVMSK